MLIRHFSKINKKYLTQAQFLQDYNPLETIVKYQTSNFIEGKPEGSEWRVANQQYFINSSTDMRTIVNLDPKKPLSKFIPKKFVRLHSLKHNLLFNQYCILQDENGVYLEVRTQSKSFFCDIQELKVVECLNWYYSPSKETIYTVRKINKKEFTIFFKSYILWDESKTNRGFFVDGNKLNFRRHNLLPYDLEKSKKT